MGVFMKRKIAKKKKATAKTPKVKRFNSYIPVGVFLDEKQVVVLIERGGNFYKAFEQPNGSFKSEDKPVSITPKTRKAKGRFSAFSSIFINGTQHISFLCIAGKTARVVLTQIKERGKKKGHWRASLLTDPPPERQGCVHVWREQDFVIEGLISRDGFAYPFRTKKFKEWEHADVPAIHARGEDFDPNRPKMFFDHTGVEVLGIFDIREGALVIYQSAISSAKEYSVALGAALFEVKGFEWKERWRTELPICKEALAKKRDESIHPLGAIKLGDLIRVFWGSTEGHIYTFAFPQPFAYLKADAKAGAALHRPPVNPIVVPNPAHGWEAVATLNPAAILVDGMVHLFYRAIGNGGRSVWGHAISSDGLHFTRFPEPIYVPDNEAEGSGVSRKKKIAIDLRCPSSGVDGAEDPRATVVDGDVHVLYAAFNGWTQTRCAHIVAPLEGLEENALEWSKPTLLTAPPTRWGTGAKNAALLPKKIGDSYVLFHRVWPDICIDYTPSLDFAEFREVEGRWLEPKGKIRVRPAHWDSGKVLVGAPPLETKEGWLLIYNAVSHQHDGGGYKIGAMILDRNNLEKVLYRSKRPILTAEAWYEATGITPRVTYACGAVIKDGILFVYYGGADTYVNVATATLDEFLTALKRDPVEQTAFESVECV